MSKYHRLCVTNDTYLSMNSLDPATTDPTGAPIPYKILIYAPNLMKAPDNKSNAVFQESKPNL